MMRKKNGKHRAALLAAVTALFLLFGQTAFAAEQTPLREVHKVAAGEMMYCFFVQHNVVLTPAEIAAIADDRQLTETVLEKAGLYMRESSCRDAGHPVITAAQWLAAGNTLELSDIDIIKLRQAAPAAGEPVKLHLDLRFTVKGADEEAPEESQTQPGESQTQPEESQSGPADTEITPPADTDEMNPATTLGELQDNPAGEEKAAPEDEETPAPEDEEPGEPEEPDDPAADRPVYSTFKKTSPELLFIVIATEEDAKAAEDTCGPAREEPEEPAEPEEPEEPAGEPEAPEDGLDDPEFPEDGLDMDLPGETDKKEILPENRTIKMTDKNLAPVAETLQEGEPVSLTWEEPKTIDTEEAKAMIDRIPGGAAGLGAAGGLVLAAGAATALAVRKRRSRDGF